jgi:hypothetical protein
LEAQHSHRTTRSSRSTCPEALGLRGIELLACTTASAFSTAVRTVFHVWRSAIVLLAGSILWWISKQLAGDPAAAVY